MPARAGSIIAAAVVLALTGLLAAGPAGAGARNGDRAPAAAVLSPQAPAHRATASFQASVVRKPPVVWSPIPFGAKRKAETVRYVRRHYGSFMKPTWRLIDPKVIVIHYTDGAYGPSYNTFANDVPDVELHELPATSAHFLINSNGVIHQLVSLGTIARHTVGLNWTAIGIEHVGFSDAGVLDNHAEMSSSLRLVHWLTCRFHILIRNVIGHNESLSSPYHHEDVPALRHQTHQDFVHRDMQTYRRRLRALGGC